MFSLKKKKKKHVKVGIPMIITLPSRSQARKNKKLSSLWRGPYTVIDRVGTVTYQVQLIGSPKTLVVHRN